VLDLRYALSNIAEDANEAAKNMLGHINAKR